MDFLTAVKTSLRQYAMFSGRASRAAYWYWVLFYVLISLVCNVLDTAFMTPIDPDEGRGPIELIFLILALVPTIAVSVRRLHDINRSGWWMLVGFIPVVGLLVLIIWHCTRGTEGDNRFGPDPLTALTASSTALDADEHRS